MPRRPIFVSPKAPIGRAVANGEIDQEKANQLLAQEQGLSAARTLPLTSDPDGYKGAIDYHVRTRNR